MSEVFISYKREERQKAHAIAEAVANKGYETWWDVDLLPGDRFIDEIEAVVSNANVAVVLWSQHSVKSHFVLAEAKLALEKNILVPVRLDDTDIPFTFREVHTLDLRNWNGTAEDPVLGPLLEAIEKRIGKRNAVPASADDVKALLGKPEAEADYWKSISSHEKQNVAEYEAYLKKYGSGGVFADLAKLRIESLGKEKKRSWPKIAKIIAGIATIVGIVAGGTQIASEFGLFDKEPNAGSASTPPQSNPPSANTGSGKLTAVVPPIQSEKISSTQPAEEQQSTGGNAIAPRQKQTVSDRIFITDDGSGTFFVSRIDVVDDHNVRVKIEVEGKSDRTISYPSFTDELRRKLGEYLTTKFGNNAPKVNNPGDVVITNLGEVTAHLGLFPAVIDDIEATVMRDVEQVWDGNGNFFLHKVKVNLQGRLDIWVGVAGQPDKTFTQARLEETFRERSNRALNDLLPPSDNLVQNAISEVSVRNLHEIQKYLKNPA